MNILISLTYYSPYVSGLTIYAQRIAEGFSKKGNNVRVMAMKHDRNLAQEEVINGVWVHRATPLFQIGKGFISLQWISLIWHQIQEADTVIVNLPQLEGWIPALFAKLFGKKIIAIYHCEIQLPKDLINQVSQVFVEITNSITLLFSDHVVTYTKDYADHSRMLKPFLHKTTYILPLVPKPTIDKIVRKKLEKKLSFPRKILIGVAARLAAEKGIEYLLEAIPMLNAKCQMPNRKHHSSFNIHHSTFKIVIAGPMDPVGERSYKTKIMTLVEKYKDQVVFLGSLSQKEIGAFYSLLDVLVLPSVNSTEAFGLVQVEAMLCGVPVVASDLPGVRVPIQMTGMGKIVPTRDSAAIANAIVDVISDKKKFIKSVRQIEKEFFMEKSIFDYEAIV